MRVSTMLGAGLVVLLLAGAAQAAGEDFRITLLAGQPPRFEGQGVVGVLTEVQPGGRVAWDLTTAKAQLLGLVEADAYFAVARPLQVYPEVDPHFDFHEAPAEGVTADAGTRLVNATLGAGVLRMWLTFPVEGNVTLTLTRDVQPPGFTLGPVQNLTDHSFYIETQTTEYARADLRVQPAAGGEGQRNPTAQRALLQRFPVTGLSPDTTYMAWLEVWDWSDNRARSDNFTVRTLPAPVRPAPIIGALEPPANATLRSPVSLLAVNFSGPAPASLEGVAVFVDKAPTRDGLALLPGRVEIRLATPLGRGAHSVGVELTAQEGGRAVARWSFEVEPMGAPGIPLALGLLAMAGAGAAAGRRRA